MKFSYNWLKDYLPNLPKPEKLAENLALKSFEVEKIEKAGADYVLDVKILPNRFSDASGHLGLAKEISAVLNIKIKEPAISIKEAAEKTSSRLMVKINDSKDCLRYSARTITGVKVGPSPKWLAEKITSCGLQPINNIVDASNFVMLETGQPLHCFDYDKISGQRIKSIIVRRAKKQETMMALDGKNYELDPSILVIADPQQPLAIAGIKGGQASGINDGTSNIVLESANFDPIIIRLASRSLKLTTDASTRFEHGVDPNITETAINRLADVIQKVAGGKISKGIVDSYPHKQSKKALGFDLIKFQEFSGITIPTNQIKDIFKRLGFTIAKQTKNNLVLITPTGRLDIERFEDLAEEILRIYDYNKVPEAPATGILIPAVPNEEITWRRQIKRTLAALGLNEVYNYAFISKTDLANYGLKWEETIAIANPLSSEFEFLRPTLIINLLKNAGSNFRFYDEVKIFELAKVFQKGAVEPYEEWRVAGLISRKDKKIHSFLELKGIIEKMFEAFGLWNLEFQDLKQNSWLLNGRSAEIKIDGESLGFIGEINPTLTQKYNDDYPAVIFEMDLAKIVKSVQEELEYEPLAKFPAVIRDISLLVSAETRVSEILNIINDSENKILRDVDLFDVYEGEKLGLNKKSLSFHLIFQSPDRTLTTDEIGKSLEKIISNLKAKLGAEIR
ncbi:MAG TPA: phenylalanine--tRNA ligase subunit beta [Candidatus Paceibacterota bacterium]|nr:phenylalanine--tRNA ligase subunit beta [Candidatus Paceibacterota bacterium]